MKKIKVKTNYSYLSFHGSVDDAFGFVTDTRTAYALAGMDMSKTLNDFVFSIEVALQNAGYLDEDFNKHPF